VETLRDKIGLQNLQPSKPRVLLVTLEFEQWRQARSYCYWFGLGLEEGFEANGVEFTTLFVDHQYGPKRPNWLAHAPRLLDGQHYDQAWVEVVHSDLDDSFLEWLSSVAPVRVAFSPEVLKINEQERAGNPAACAVRDEALARRIPHFTHLMTLDECDVERLNHEGAIQTLWMGGGHMPARCIRPVGDSPEHDVGFFFGTLYNKERRGWLRSGALRDLLVAPGISLEDLSDCPARFEKAHLSSRTLLTTGRPTLEEFDLVLNELRTVRQAAFDLWLETLSFGNSMVNLPQLSYAYAGRVYEGMAAGRPAVSWEIPDRPRLAALYRNEEEILLYPRDRPNILAAQLLRLQRDPAFRDHVAANARSLMLGEHTTEAFVRRVWNWADPSLKLPPLPQAGRAMFAPLATSNVDRVQFRERMARSVRRSLWENRHPFLASALAVSRRVARLPVRVAANGLSLLQPR